ncbi:molecular chaperone HtpG [Hydrogenophaga sp.]|uniref:molecular chaperone HtpG n=1 Tax=Hydrogenophaga sp. TaxID=1904254 RepID=UPI0025C27292|nr:molecular chaperone HtpG [Hydrogenophaga sp.]
MNPTEQQTHSFQAEVREVLRLMIHSLYSNKEIFLRELISNASDACDKLRFEALRDDALLADDPDLRIEIEVDTDGGCLRVRDNGIGMNREEVTEHIGTIARSGTRQFLEQATGDEELDRQLIGQFGVGFYSAFIVADRVTLLTRRAGDAPSEGVYWESAGSGEYTIRQVERPERGTEVILHLKEAEHEFLETWRLRALVSRYSDHIGFPIRFRTEAAADDEGEAPEAGGWETVNQASALWTLPRADLDEDDYRAFYKHISHDLEDPLCWSHNHVEGAQTYINLLYVPSRAPLDILLQRDERRGLRLYVKRVFIMDAAEQLLPHYLRFIRGVVDSDDLPLNVSRELLQENELVGKIRAAVVKRALDMLSRLADEDAERYLEFWDQFGAVLKEGIVEDHAHRERIAGLLRFASTHDSEAGQRTSLAEYLARMPADQETIWYITADSHRAASHSPHLEIFRQRGIEVLLMSDRIDEWMMGYFTEYEGRRFRSIAKGEVGFEPAQAEPGGEDAQPARPQLLERIAEVLGEAVAEVRASQRLTESASCLVLGEQELALHMRQLLQQAGQAVPDAAPVLEVNLGHPLLKRLETEASDQAFTDLAHILHQQAVLAEGGQLDDPAAFVQRLNRVMAGAPAETA